MNPEEFLTILEAFPEEYGTVRDRYLGGDAERFVLIFQNVPENWSVRWAIGKALHHFEWVKIVGRDGAWHPIDTALIYTIPDKDIRQKVALDFLKMLLLAPSEYANALRGETAIHLVGVEDQTLYNRAKRLFRSQPDFLRLQIERAHAICINLLHQMEKHGEKFAVLTCCGDLPDLVSEELEQKGISYAIIYPKMSHPSDRKRYLNLLQGKMPSDEEILQDTDVGIEMLPENANFPDKEIEDMKEQARINLINLIDSGNLFSKLEPLLPSVVYESIVRIVNLAKYGSKTKAVLVKAELMSFVLPVATKLDRPRELGLGVLGVIAAVIGTLFGFYATIGWYHIGIVVLFGLALLNALLVKRFASALRWCLHIFGYLCGFYLFGRWGALLGVALATLIGLGITGRERRMVQRKSQAVLAVQHILEGKGRKHNRESV